MGNLGFAIIDSKSRFEERLANGEIDENWVVFIEDSREIWTHNLYFGVTDLNTSDIDNRVTNLENVIKEIGTEEAVKQSHVVLSEEEYQARLDAGTIYDDVFYYIKEE